MAADLSPSREDRILAKMAELEELEIIEEARKRLKDKNDKKEAAKAAKKVIEEAEKARRVAIEREQQQRRAAAMAVQKRKKEEGDKIRPFVKLAFSSYYSMNSITSGMFKKHQKTLIEMGVTAEHLKDPNINRARYKPDAFEPLCGRRDDWWKDRVIDMSFLLTAGKTRLEEDPTYGYYSYNGPSTWPIWIE